MCVGIYVLVDRYWELGVKIYLYVLGNVVWGGKLQKKKEYKKFLFFSAISGFVVVVLCVPCFMFWMFVHFMLLLLPPFASSTS